MANFVNPSSVVFALSAVMVIMPTVAYASELDDALAGFDSPSATATNDLSDLDASLGGFDEPSVVVKKAIATPPKKVSALQFSGQLSSKNAMSYQSTAPVLGNADYRGVTKTQFSGLLKANYRISPDWKAKVELKGFYDPIYSTKGRENYSSDSLNTHESELDIREAFIVGSATDDLDIKMGRQVSVWGKSDSIRITDLLNPLDSRELGLVDIEDLRLPVLMSRMDYYAGDWQVSLQAQHEHRNPKEAAIDSEFFPTSALPLPANFNFPDVENTDIAFEDTTLSIAANGRFSGWDLSLYAGRFQDGRWHFENNKTAREYGLIDMGGFAANVVALSWLLKTEVAVINGLKYNTVAETKSRYDVLLGGEYKGISDLTLSIELADRYLPEHEKAMEGMPDAVFEHNYQTAFRALYRFDHDKAMLGYLVQGFGHETNDLFGNGGFQRLWIDYELTQSVNLVSGVIDYIGGDSVMLNAMRNNDKLFLELKYYF